MRNNLPSLLLALFAAWLAQFLPGPLSPEQWPVIVLLLAAIAHVAGLALPAPRTTHHAPRTPEAENDLT